jgi:hypothetical protein
MKLPVYKLDINEFDEDSGIDFISLVEAPAIQKDFVAFNQAFVEPKPNESEEEFISRCIPILIGEGKEQAQAVAICYSYLEKKFESYTDYPEAAKENAQRGIRLNEEQGNKCATQVGKVRAQQLANSEPISDETVKRVYSYLSRAKEYYNPSDDTACGTISYLLWGGEEMLRWAESKLNFNKFSITNEEKRIVSGVAMVADLPIYRRDAVRGEYYVMFDREAIFKLAKKWARNGKYSSVNQHHESEVKGVHLLESYLIDRERGVNPPNGFEKIADGSWFVSYLVDNDEVWAKVKDGEFKGFSVEGMFDFVDEETELYNKLKRVVSQWDGN